MKHIWLELASLLIIAAMRRKQCSQNKFKNKFYNLTYIINL